MTLFAYATVFGFAALMLDILCRSINIFACFCAVFICCSAKSFGCVFACVLSIVLGAMLDFMAGYEYSFSIFTFMLLAVSVYFADRRMEAFSTPAACCLGGIMPFVLFVPQIIYTGGIYALTTFFPHIFLSALLTAGAMPCAIMFFDSVNEKLALAHKNTEAF